MGTIRIDAMHKHEKYVCVLNVSWLQVRICCFRRARGLIAGILSRDEGFYFKGVTMPINVFAFIMTTDCIT